MEISLSNIGNSITNKTTEFLSNQVSNIGLNPENLPMKLLSILVLLIGIYFSLKIAKVGVKIGIIVVIALIILSIGASIL